MKKCLYYTTCVLLLIYLHGHSPNMATTTRNSRGGRPKSASGSGKTDENVTNCIFCDLKIDDRTPAVNCDNCNNWICLPCSKIPLSMYNELKKCSDDSAFEWKCKSCKGLKGELKNIHKTLLDLKHDNDTRLTIVENQLSSLTESVKTTVVEEVEKAKESLSKSLTDDLASIVKDNVQHQLKELEERKNRSTNLVIFNLPLCTAPDPKERKDTDSQTVKNLFKALCPDKGDLLIKTCFRLQNKKKRGSKNSQDEGADSNDTTPPPLKVVFESKEQRRSLMLKSKNIRDLPDPVLKNLILVRDLTIEQRKDFSALQNERKQREEAGENVTIRNGKVVTAPPPSSFRE